MSAMHRRCLLFLFGVILLLVPVLLLHHAEAGHRTRLERQDRTQAEQRLHTALDMFRRSGSPDAFLGMRLQGIIDQVVAGAVGSEPRTTPEQLAKIAGEAVGGPEHRDLSFVAVSLIHQAPAAPQEPFGAPATFSFVSLVNNDSELSNLLKDLLGYLFVDRMVAQPIFKDFSQLNTRFQDAFTTTVGIGLMAGKFRGRAIRLWYRGRPCWLFWQIIQPVDASRAISGLPRDTWFTPGDSRLTYSARAVATIGGMAFLISGERDDEPAQHAVSSFDDTATVVGVFPVDGGRSFFSRRFPLSEKTRAGREAAIDEQAARLRQRGMLVATGTAFFGKPYRVLVGTIASSLADGGFIDWRTRLVLGWAGFLVGSFLLGRALFADRGIAGTLRGQLLSGFFLMLLLPSATVFWITEDLAVEQLEALEQETRAQLRRGMDERQRRFVGGRQEEWLNRLQVMQQPALARELDQAAAEWRRLGGHLASVTTERLRTFLEERREALRIGSFGVNLYSLGVSDRYGFSIGAGSEGTTEGGEVAETFSRLSVPILQAIVPGPDEVDEPVGGGGLQAGARDEMAAEVIREVVLSCLGPEGYFSLVYGLGNNILVRLGVAFSHFSLIPIPSAAAPRFQAFTLYSARGSDLEQIAAALANQEGEFRYYACDFERIGAGIHPELHEGNPLLRRAAALTRLVQEPQSLRLRLDGEPYLVETALNFPNHQFMVLGTAPERPLRERVERLKHWQQALLLLSLLLTWAMAWLSAGDMLRPVKSLVERMNGIWNGDFSVRIHEKRRDELGQLCDAFDRMAKGLQEGKLLGRMVSTQARRTLEAGGAEEVGRRCEVTVLYLGFGVLERAGMAEDPETLIRTLDLQVREACRLILAAGGDIDKVMGDKVLAVFPHGERPAEAVAGAISALREFDRSRREGRLPLPVAAGLSCGTVITGFLGSATRRDHTVIGDPVNLAARCEGLAERYPDAPWVCTEAFRSLAPDSVGCEELDVTSVKGKTEAVRLFRVVSWTP